MSWDRAPNEWVRRLRVQRGAPGYYLDVMALDLGVTRQAVSKLLEGHTEPKAPVVARAELAYGIHASEWVQAPKDDGHATAVARESLSPSAPAATVEGQ